MENPIEINAREARELVKSDGRALLVCAYESEHEFHEHELEGAISLYEFHSREPSLTLERYVVFYCACPHDEAALKQARKSLSEGYKNVRVLKGGVNAWKEAGFPIMQKI